MLRIPGGVLTRVIIVVLAALAAVATLAPAPAGAMSWQDDPLADAAATTLGDLQASEALAASVASTAATGAATGGLSLADVAAADATYQADLAVVASLVAPRTSSPPEAFLAAWSAAGSTRMTVLLSALGQVGVPYRRNTSNRGVSFDCSGFTMYAWSQVGVALPHQDQGQIRASAARTWDTALAGDLVDYPGHVMMFVGAGNAIVHAPNTGSVVTVRELNTRRRVRLGSPLG